MRYDVPDQVLESEKIIYGKFLEEKFNGRILDAGNSLQGLLHTNISSDPKFLKTIKFQIPQHII